ncbi:DinB family protein [Pedobacter psychroterrae]|uniref:DinB family protein n=1 Tax=Pedobacter psychroterrae TaxID=2530453 RepID=A0A4R0NQF5_9SPHI|nr:DinB family protein [Pedobacter psychroterrae]TCD02409.1 DinB family protein [Pedobacter psychroterrae]
MIDFSNELRKAYIGDAWHGNNVSCIISSVKDNQAFSRPIVDAHSIAEIVLHLTSWTEEVSSRLMGKISAEPAKGDWPSPIEETTVTWNAIVSDFHIENEKLINLSMSFMADDWAKHVQTPSGRGISYFELFNGLIQHHAYHAGQISLLLKFRS